MSWNEAGFWREDLRRYPRLSLLNQPGLWAIGVYRFGRWTYVAPLVLRPFFHAVYFASYSVIRLATGIDIPRSVAVGPGLMIHHFGGIIINPRVTIGAFCTMRHGLTLGSRVDDGPVPVVGDYVTFGAYAQVLGGVRLGERSIVGALSLVLEDIPDNHTAIGIPARARMRQ